MISGRADLLRRIEKVQASRDHLAAKPIGSPLSEKNRDRYTQERRDYAVLCHDELIDHLARQLATLP